MGYSEKPWQAMPQQIISLALSHARRNTDFDHQIAFLLLDIGVETSLKTFLINKKYDVEKMVFPELIKHIKNEIIKANLNVELDEIEYFHRIRNKLYHQGDGVKPTTENLDKYTKLAKNIASTLLEMDIPDSTNNEQKEEISLEDFRYGNVRKFTIYELAENLCNELNYFQDCCGFYVEKTIPQLATREFAGKYRKVFENYFPETFDENNPVTSASLIISQKEDRQRGFEELLGSVSASTLDEIFNLFEEDVTSYRDGNLDFILGNINHFYVMLSLFDLANDPKEDFDKYIRLVVQTRQLNNEWTAKYKNSQTMTSNIFNEFEAIHIDIKSLQTHLDSWSELNSPNLFNLIDGARTTLLIALYKKEIEKKMNGQQNIDD